MSYMDDALDAQSDRDQMETIHLTGQEGSDLADLFGEVLSYVPDYFRDHHDLSDRVDLATRFLAGVELDPTERAAGFGKREEEPWT